MDEPGPRPQESGSKARIAWCLFDFANSSFPTVITTFVFAAYYIKAIAPTPEQGTTEWGYANAFGALLIAIASPVLGAIADNAGPRKPWLFALSAVCIAATALLWFARPEASAATLALTLFVIATIGFEIGVVFYNAMLNDIAPPGYLGRLSGWGWGLGYAGGLLCLAVALFVLVRPDPPLFGFDPAAAEHVRATGPLVALWFAVFAVPLFLYVPDLPSSGKTTGEAVRAGLNQLRATLANIRAYRTIVRYLIARMIYTDALVTLFAFGGVYAAGTFGMALDEVIMFGIAINVTSGLGAAAFAWIDDWLGAKPTILIALAGLIVLGVAILVIHDKTWFWLLGLGLGIFFGPAQAASRSLMARLAPKQLETEMFGLYALSGKATAFMGPFALGLVTDIFDSQRAGMATIIVFLAVGFILLAPIKVASNDPGAAG